MPGCPLQPTHSREDVYATGVLYEEPRPRGVGWDTVSTHLDVESRVPEMLAVILSCGCEVSTKKYDLIVKDGQAQWVDLEDVDRPPLVDDIVHYVTEDLTCQEARIIAVGGYIETFEPDENGDLVGKITPDEWAVLLDNGKSVTHRWDDEMMIADTWHRSRPNCKK